MRQLGFPVLAAPELSEDEDRSLAGETVALQNMSLVVYSARLDEHAPWHQQQGGCKQGYICFQVSGFWSLSLIDVVLRNNCFMQQVRCRFP